MGNIKTPLTRRLIATSQTSYFTSDEIEAPEASQLTLAERLSLCNHSNLKGFLKFFSICACVFQHIATWSRQQKGRFT